MKGCGRMVWGKLDLLCTNLDFVYGSGTGESDLGTPRRTQKN